MSAVKEDIDSFLKALIMVKQKNLDVLNNNYPELDGVKIAECLEFRDAAPSLRTAGKPVSILLRFLAKLFAVEFVWIAHHN